MQLGEELNNFKGKCLNVLQNLKNIKKVDKDSIAQMNQSICQFGDHISNLISQNEQFQDSHKEQIEEVVSLYEETTQNLDDIIYKHKGVHSLIQSDYKSQIYKDSQQQKNNGLKKDISQFTYFRHLEKLNILEDQNVEFKNYTMNSFNNRDIRYICKKTIVSFLNRNGGCIYLGIRDDSMVVGMKLDYSQMDSLKRKIITIKSGISPQMNEKVKVDFVPIKQGQRWYKGHWIVRIQVKQGDLNTLYYFNNQNDLYYLESYFREDGAVIRYKIHDFIQEQIDMALQKNPKSRILIKKEYAPADQVGLESSIIWESQDQSGSSNQNQNQSGSQQKYQQLSNQKFDSIQKEDQKQMVFLNKFQANPFQNINVNEHDLDKINIQNQQEQIIKLQQDAAQRKNQLIQNKVDNQNDQFQKKFQKKKLKEELDEQIKNMRTPNPDNSFSQNQIIKDQESDKKIQINNNQYQQQQQQQYSANSQRQNRVLDKNISNNTQNQYVYEEKKNTIQVVKQNQPEKIPPQNVTEQVQNNVNQKKKTKKFGAMFYQALCGDQQQQN